MSDKVWNGEGEAPGGDFFFSPHVMKDEGLNNAYRQGAIAALHAVANRMAKMHKAGQMTEAAANQMLENMVRITAQVTGETLEDTVDKISKIKV